MVFDRLKGRKDGDRSLHVAAGLTLGEPPQAKRLVVLVDQFEEVFAICNDESERRDFIANLLHAATVARGRTIVVLTMRADFYPRCTAYADLAAALSDQQVLVGPMTDDELRRAIEHPARLAGLEPEPGLVDLLVDEIRGRAGALPLLQFALQEVWRRREDYRLTIRTYREIGEIEGALQRKADAVYDGFTPDQRELCRRVFLRLVQPGEGSEDMRRRASLRELLPDDPAQAGALQEIISRLADPESRLLTTERQQTASGEGTLEIAHEALIRGWSHLRKWIEADRAGLRTHLRLTEAAKEWADAGAEAKEGALYTGARLAVASEWAASHRDELGALEAAFLSTSQEHERQKRADEAEKHRRLAEAERLRAEEAEARKREAEAAGEHQKKLSQRFLIAAAVSLLLALAAVLQTLRANWASEEATTAASDASNSAIREKEAREEAEKNASLAKKTADKLKVQSLALERELYTLGLDVAQREWEAANLGRVRSLLAGFPTGLRGWEYDYLYRLCHLDRRTLPATDLFTFSPDSTRLAGADERGALRIWSLTDGGSLAVKGLAAPADVTGVTWSPQGDRLFVSGHADGAVWEADSATGETHSLSGAHTKADIAVLAVLDVDWSPDRTLIVTSRSTGWGSNVRIFRSGSARLERALTGHGSQVYAVAWSPDGRYIATGSADRTARIWDAASGTSKVILTRHRREIHDVAWGPDGARLATAGADATVRLWDPRSGRELHVLEGHTDEVQAVTFAPDGRRLASVSWDRTLRLWDVESGAAITTMRGHEGRVMRVAWSPDGTRLATRGEEGTIKVWDATHPASGDPKLLAGSPGAVRAVAWSPDGSRLVTACDDHQARIWEATSGRLIYQLKGHTGPIYAVSWSHDGTHVATAGLDGLAMTWDAASGRALARFRGHHPQQIYSVVWSADDTRVATAATDGLFKLWNPATGEELSSVRGRSQAYGYISGLSWSPDGARLALALAPPENSVRVFDLGLGVPVLNLKDHQHGVSAVAWSPDGTALASASFDKTVRVWDGLTGTLKSQLAGHASFVYTVAWSPDGKRLASGGQDRSVKVWEPRSGTELLTLKGHPDVVHSVSWSPDGTNLASGSTDGTVRLWSAGLPDRDRTGEVR
jgi:WD40 repeat protein